MAANIAVKDRGQAEEWVRKANALNERARVANEQVAALLRQLDEGAAGESVDKLVNWGTQMLSFSQQIFDGVTQISNGISGVIDLVSNAVTSVSGILRNIAGTLG